MSVAFSVSFLLYAEMLNTVSLQPFMSIELVGVETIIRQFYSTTEWINTIVTTETCIILCMVLNGSSIGHSPKVAFLIS